MRSGHIKIGPCNIPVLAFYKTYNRTITVFYFAPGDLGYRVFKTRFADIGVLICWDQWFPEAARLTAMAGAELIVIPTAIGHSAPEDEADAIAYRDGWQIVQRGHAVANACYLAAVNRAQYVVENYQYTPAVRDALAIMIISYERMGMEELYRDALRVLALNEEKGNFVI